MAFELLEHLHLVVRAEVLKPPTDILKSEQWLGTLVKAIGMQELAPPRAIYSDMPGNRGITCDVLLSTSNAIIHVWDEPNPALFMLDVFTCGSLDIMVIFDMLQEFEPVKLEYLYLDRKSGLKILDQNTL